MHKIRSPSLATEVRYEEKSSCSRTSCVLTTTPHNGHGDRNQEIKLREKLEEDEFTVIEGVSALPLSSLA